MLFRLLGRQLLRAGASVGAQYREATRGKSTADFISKVEGSLQELEESEYWLELLASQDFPGGKTACAKERNRGVEGDIRQHRQKYQSQGQTSTILLKLSLIFLPLSVSIRPRGFSAPTVPLFFQL
ncbi:MAG TPA: four helix bundle protein [Candidatus Binatia bacterium]|nr:four helix bundle protein [Candidatus Binatia bacterium]